MKLQEVLKTIASGENVTVAKRSGDVLLNGDVLLTGKLGEFTVAMARTYAEGEVTDITAGIKGDEAEIIIYIKERN